MKTGRPLGMGPAAATKAKAIAYLGESANRLAAAGGAERLAHHIVRIAAMRHQITVRQIMDTGDMLAQEALEREIEAEGDA